MNLKNTMITIIIFFMIFLSAYFYSKSNIESEASSVRIQNKLYSWEETVEDSLKNYDSVQPASVISDINAFDKVVALTFDGMVDSETTKQILKLLEEYHSQATFFLPGIKSAEDPETVQMIASSGQEVGNYTLSAQRELDSLDTDSIINDFFFLFFLFKKLFFLIFHVFYKKFLLDNLSNSKNHTTLIIQLKYSKQRHLLG